MLSQGELDLSTLLAHMRPSLQPEKYVFCVLDPTDPAVANLREDALATILEDEGLTLLVPPSLVQHLPHSGVFQVLTLRIHSSLDAVGLLAAIATELAKHNISANTLSAYYHDHLLIPEADAQAALSVLQALSERHREV